MWWTVVGILGGVLGAIYLFLTWNFNRWRDVGITGPKPRVLFGNLPNILTKKQHVYYDYQKMYNDYKNEPVVGFFSVRTPQLMIRDPELIKEVLTKGFRYFAANDFSDTVDEKSDPLFARNPFSLSGEKWKTRRAEITPAFTNNRIKALSVLMDEVCTKMTDYINNKIKQEESSLDTKELMAKYTTDVVSNCVFAIDAQSFSKDKPEIREMGRRIMDFNFSAQVVLLITTFLPSVKNFYKFTFIPREVEHFFIRIMQDAINHRKKNNIERNDYLDHLLSLQEKKQISEIDMAGHGVSFFADGFETSSLVMTYCLYDLASHPVIQKRLREEIRNVQASKGGINYDNIGEMTFLDQVLNESLRLHPIIPTLAKRCTESTVLIGPKDKKYPVSAGTTVVIPYFVQLDPQYYEEPDKFNPDRFSPENGGSKPYRERGVFFPFGEGPRMCLGMRFALAQAKRGIVEILDKFELTVDPKTQVPLQHHPEMFMLYPKGGIWLKYKSINEFNAEAVVGYISVRTPQLMIRDPELIKEVLSKEFRCFAANDFSDVVDEKSDPLFARNPFCLSGEKWKTRRADITPGFTNSRIKAMSVLMDAVCTNMTEYVTNKIKHNECSLDTKELMSKYTTDVVSNCAFAIDAQSFSKDKPEIREMGRRIMDFNFTAQVVVMVTTFLPSVKKFYKFSFIPREVEAFFIRITRDAIRHRVENNITRNDYLEHLLSLQEKKQISEIDMAGQSVSFFADGFETSSSVMAYCLYDLASHPEIQQRLREEIRHVQSNKGGINYDNIGEMVFLEQVLDETLRLHPVIPVLAKRCTEDTVLIGPKDKKIPVSVGTTVVVPLLVQTDPQFYEEPEKYNPDRFSPENGGSKPYREQGVYFPFGEGPRMCLGIRFALAQVKRGIVEILDKFEISVDSKMQVPLVYDPNLFMLYPKGGIWLKYKLIN